MSGCRSSSAYRLPPVAYAVDLRRREHPDTEIPDGHILTHPWPTGPPDNRRDQVISYPYRADRARRTLRGIDQQVTTAEKAVAGKVPVKRTRFIHLSGATKTVNQTLQATARSLAGLTGYITNLDATSMAVTTALRATAASCSPLQDLAAQLLHARQPVKLEVKGLDPDALAASWRRLRRNARG